MNSNTAKGYIFVVLSAVIYGSMPLMSKYIYAGMYTNEFDSSRNAYKIKLLNIKYREYYYVLKAYKTNDTANLTDRQRKLYPVTFCPSNKGRCFAESLCFFP